MKFSFEELESPDFPRVEEMARVIWPGTYSSIISLEQMEFMLGEMYSEEKIKDEIQSGDARYFWILSDRVRIGFTAFGPLIKNRGCEIHKLYILPQHHRIGAGQFGISQIQTIAENVGSNHLELRVNRNNTRAISFYEARGFEIHATDCKDIGKGFVMDDFILRKQLDDGKVFPS